MAVFDVLQRQLVYFPMRGPVRSARRYAESARDITLTTDDGLTLGAWWFPASGPAGLDRATAVLFTPGNGGHREGRAPLFLTLARHGFSVLGLDYRGYGENAGTPSEAGLAADARAAVAWIRGAGFDPAHTLYLGESLGTGVAARLSTTHPPAGLLLRSPFPSLLAVGRHLYRGLPLERLIGDRFDTSTHLAGCPVPVSVLRGELDGIVPSALSAQVAHGVPHLLEDIEVPGADHNDAIWYGEFVAAALDRLAAAATAG